MASPLKLVSLRSVMDVNIGSRDTVEHLVGCAAGGKLKDVKQALRRKSITLLIDELDSRGMTALGAAAHAGHLDIVTLLLQKGADVNKSDLFGLTALQYAAEFQHILVVKYLIKQGANLDWMDTNNDGLSAIHIVACKGQTEVAKVLLDAGCSVNAQDINGVSVLHCAVANGHQEIVERLLVAGANLNVQGSTTGRTPLFMAVDAGDQKMVDLLLKYCPKLNIKDDYGMTPLCAACLRNKVPGIARSLIKDMAKVNIPDHKNNLPLHYTCRSGNLELTRLLLNAGSDINALNKYFESPLHLAVRMSHINIIEELVHRGCDVNQCEPYANVTALHVAVNTYTDASLFRQVLDILISGGCWLDTRAFSTLETPLYRAIDQNKSLFALDLLQNGASPNVDCPFENTMLYKACQKEQYETIETLLYSDIDWRREAWLDRDKYSCGISPRLLTHYPDNVPTVLHYDIELFFKISQYRHNPARLIHCCRLVVRRAINTQLHANISKIHLPKKLEDYLMLKIL